MDVIERGDTEEDGCERVWYKLWELLRDKCFCGPLFSFLPKVSPLDQPLFECVSLKDKDVLCVEMCGNVLGLYVGKRRSAVWGGGMCVDMS